MNTRIHEYMNTYIHITTITFGSYYTMFYITNTA